MAKIRLQRIYKRRDEDRYYEIWQLLTLLTHKKRWSRFFKKEKLHASVSYCHFCTHKNSYKPEWGLQKLCSSSLPNLTYITFRVFGSLECDWERKTMHWSSLDSVLLSALQRKVVGERSRPKKINHIYIILSGWVKKNRKEVHRCLAVTHPRAKLRCFCLALGSVDPLSMCSAKVKAIQKCGAALLTFEFGGRWEQSMITSKLEGGVDKTNWLVWHRQREKTEPGSTH